MSNKIPILRSELGQLARKATRAKPGSAQLAKILTDIANIKEDIRQEQIWRS